MQNKANDVGHGWASDPKIDSEFNRVEYDEIADTYEEFIDEWGYEGPKVAAEIMARFLPLEGAIADCGCGTGLTGKALHQAGYRNLIGFDISPKSLARAKEKNVYTELQETDLNVGVPLADDAVDGLLCVAVMAFLDAKQIFPEFCRVVRSGGCILFSQRVDLFEKRNYQQTIDELQQKGIWTPLYASEPMLYLPGHEAYQDQIKVQYFAFRVSENEG